MVGHSGGGYGIPAMAVSFDFQMREEFSYVRLKIAATPAHMNLGYGARRCRSLRCLLYFKGNYRRFSRMTKLGGKTRHRSTCQKCGGNHLRAYALRKESRKSSGGNNESKIAPGGAHGYTLAAAATSTERSQRGASARGARSDPGRFA